MRRFLQELTQEECAAALERNTCGVLSLSGANGYPYPVPMCYTYSDGTLYFHSAKAGYKLDCLKTSDKASFCVIDYEKVEPEKYSTLYRSVVAFGRARVVSDADEVRSMAETLGKKYAPLDSPENLRASIERNVKNMLVIAFDIEHMTGKESMDLKK